MRISFAVLLLAMIAAPLAAQGEGASFTIRETGQGFASLQAAVDAIGDGSGTIDIAPGTYRQCAVQEAGDIAYVAREFGSVAFERRACEEKAALVLRGRSARVEGIVFQNMRVPDGNGAGIRLQEGDLLVRESLFRDSETGILTHNDGASSLRIEQSTFSGLGRCREDGGCSHSLYAGDYGSVSVVRTRFERGRGGHYLKSRSARIEVLESSFDDSQGSATNYHIDLPYGATGRIAGNVFVQGRNKENYTALITVAPEGVQHASDGLAVAGNQADLAPDARRRTTFVADWSGERIAIGDNRLGPGITRFERR
jgi:hypothetical protein